MEKIKEILLKDRKTSNLVLILVLLVIVLVFFNYIFNDDKTNVNEIQTVSTNVTETDNIETRLSNIISKIEGVNSASVLITYSSSDKTVPVYDTKENIDTTTEQSKTSTKKTIEKKVAYEGSQALVENKETATSSGAIIVVTGSITDNTKEEIRKAVSYATGAPIHKIQIFVN